MSLPIVRNTNKVFFEARWQSPAEATNATVEVWLADKKLGSLDLEAATTPEGVRAARRAGNAPFTPGRMVQIRFRVEVGAGEGIFPPGPRMEDGRTTGDPRLFFIPPATQTRPPAGTFDPDRVDELAVEVWGLMHGAPSVLMKRFEPGATDPTDRVRVNRDKELYQATWPTYLVKPWIDYRARIFLDGNELGWLDIDLVPLDPRFFDHPLKRARRTGVYAVIPGRQAFIRFRIDKAEPGATELSTTGVPLVRIATGRYPNAINELGDVAGETDPTVQAWLLIDGHETFVPTLGEGSTDVWAEDINDEGLVAANSIHDSGGDKAYLLTGGSEVELGDLGGDGAIAMALNNQGQVVGGSDTGDGWHAFLWDDGMMTDLGTLPGDDESWAMDVNEHAHVLGASTRDGGRAFLWQEGVMTELDPPPGSLLLMPIALNDHGQALIDVGFPGTSRHEWQAYLWDDGEWTPIPPPTDWTQIRGADLNNKGEVVGHGEAGVRAHAFLWDGADFKDLGTLLGAAASSAEGINEVGQVVGLSQFTSADPWVVIWDVR